MIYLDNASTTPIDKEVLEAMIPYLTTEYGNPGSVHPMGADARKAIDKAREQVANLINAKPENIIFTSGGSEANNLAVRSCYVYCAGELLTSGTEHDSMKNSIDEYFPGSVFMTYSGNEELLREINCILDSAVGRYVKLLSYMHTNNELGFRNPVNEIGNLCKEHNKLFIMDAVQALGSEHIDVNEIGCDFMSMSSHKINGPKGIGALYVRNLDYVEPVIYGGSNQEFGKRGGTENVAGIVGFGKACELLSERDFESDKAYITSLRGQLLNGLEFDHIVNYPIDDSKIVSLTIPGVDAETLVLSLGANGIMISAGSACKSLENKPNHAIMYAGISEELARNTIRISLSWGNTEAEISKFLCLINNIIKELMYGL